MYTKILSTVNVLSVIGYFFVVNRAETFLRRLEKKKSAALQKSTNRGVDDHSEIKVLSKNGEPGRRQSIDPCVRVDPCGRQSLITKDL